MKNDYSTMTAQGAYNLMSDAERVELIQKAVTKAASRTAARIANPEKIWKMMTDDREDIEQSAFLRLLTMQKLSLSRILPVQLHPHNNKFSFRIVHNQYSSHLYFCGFFDLAPYESAYSLILTSTRK